MAEKLLKEGHPDSELILDRQEALKEKWKDLVSISELRKEKLAAAKEIQTFHR